MEKLVVLIWIVFILYILVLAMVGADLCSGVAKARKNGVIRSSYGFRRTIEKLGRYYNVLLALTVIDTMQMSAIWYMDEFYEIEFPLFPFITLIGAIGISLIEVKSIYEKAEDKVKFDEVGALVGQILANKDNIEEMGKAVATYIKEKEARDEKTSNNTDNNLHS